MSHSAAAQTSSIAELLPADTPAIGVTCLRASGWEDGLTATERAFAWAKRRTELGRVACARAEEEKALERA